MTQQATMLAFMDCFYLLGQLRHRFVRLDPLLFLFWDRYE